MKLRTVVAQFTCVLVFCAGAFAQEFRATVQGTVSDQSGGAVPGATVTLTNSGTGIEQSTTTNAGGLYVDRPAVRDGNIITSRKPDDVPFFNEAIIAALSPSDDVD